MADAGAERFHLDQDGVVVAIGEDFFHDQAVAGAFAFQPELLAGAAVEGGKAGLDGVAKGLFIHVADHQHAAGGVILDHGGDEAVGFFEIEIHGDNTIEQ